MAAKLLIAFVLALTCERVLCQERDPIRHRIIWNRFWLNSNLTDNTLEVKLNDAVIFQCQVNMTGDPIENIVLLEEEAHLVQCDIGEEGQSRHLATCSSSIINHVVLITESQNLVNRPSFAANQSYYFTSFSVGTEESADTALRNGGACESSPPLKLTIKVLPTTSSTVPSPTSTASITQTAVTRDIIISTTMLSSPVATSTPSSPLLNTEPASPTNEITSNSIVTVETPEPISGIGLLTPVLSVIVLLSLLVTCINTL